jgi:hypothetical protein
VRPVGHDHPGSLQQRYLSDAEPSHAAALLAPATYPSPVAPSRLRLMSSAVSTMADLATLAAKGGHTAHPSIIAISIWRLWMSASLRACRARSSTPAEGLG